MTVTLTDDEVEFLKRLLKAVNLPGVDVAHTAVGLADKLEAGGDTSGN